MQNPETLSFVRHAESTWNRFKSEKKTTPLYLEFEKEYDKNWESERTKALALEVHSLYSEGAADPDSHIVTPDQNSLALASQLKNIVPFPDVIYVSPMIRTRESFEIIKRVWPEISGVEVRSEPRIVEQSYGLAGGFFDTKVFNVLNPEEKLKRQKLGRLAYRFPMGESVADVVARVTSFLKTELAQFVGKNVLAVSHHIVMLSSRIAIHGLSAEEFLHLERKDKPQNLKVTGYQAQNGAGEFDLKLKLYNSEAV